jgi:putative ABC transport system ATP-binding protein
MAPLLTLENVGKKHPNDNAKMLFAHMNTEIIEPASIALLGVSGQGKSTLLRVLAMLDQQDEGSIALKGINSTQWKSVEWRAQVCYVSQQAVMLPGSIEDNLRTVSLLHKREFDQALAKKLISRLELEPLGLAKTAADLSGGEKQRLALARAMMLRSDMLLLDEVTASLDLRAKQAVEHLLQEWQREEGVTLIWVTHDLAQARQQSNRVWFLANGALQEDAATASFFDRPSTSWGRDFLQHAAEGEGTR